MLSGSCCGPFEGLPPLLKGVGKGLLPCTSATPPCVCTPSTSSGAQGRRTLQIGLGPSIDAPLARICTRLDALVELSSMCGTPFSRIHRTYRSATASNAASKRETRGRREGDTGDPSGAPPGTQRDMAGTWGGEGGETWETPRDTPRDTACGATPPPLGPPPHPRSIPAVCLLRCLQMLSPYSDLEQPGATWCPHLVNTDAWRRC